jgi:hypothetical protein
MKKIFFSSLLIASSLLRAQTTATDFTANDCNGASHNLFSELDAGKVVVLVWVMPCGNCIGDALTAQTEVQNALSSNPGKILFYVADDYGTTACSSVKSWCNTNGIIPNAVFVSGAIKMSDYGANGMPKVIVLGGSNHKVYYNEIAPDITASGIQAGISSAVADINASTGITTQSATQFGITIFPSPGNGLIRLQVNLPEASKVNVEIRNELGQVVKEIHSELLNPGTQIINMDAGTLARGNYFLTATNGQSTIKERLVITQ